MDTSVDATRPADATSTRRIMLAGFVLLLVGTAALASEIWPEMDRYLPLLVGIGLLVVFAAGRSYLALVGGAVLTGLGGGLLVASMVPGATADGAGAVLGLAAGFVSVWLVSVLLDLKERHWWPLVPGGILTLVGTSLALDTVMPSIAPLIVPILLVVLGALTIIAASLRSRGRLRGSL